MSVRSRVLIGFLGTLATLAAAALSLMVTLIAWLDTCDGDGGYPFSAPESAAGRFCDSAYSAPYFVAMVVLPVLSVAGLSVLAVHRGRLATVAIGAGAACGLLVLMGMVVWNLPDSCGEELARRDPAGCESF